MKKENINSLYIHIPFCEHLCDYCDFTKVQYFSLFAKPYLIELEKELKSYDIREPKTIYIGGGTPTALEDDLFAQLLEMVQKHTSSVEEYTIEANPESLTKEKLALMKKYGVNRISIGVETTNDEILKSINRHHTFNDVKIAIEAAKEFGFDNLNVDLILGLPGTSLEQIETDLLNLIALDVQHISCYSLTVHPNTMFFLKGIQEPYDDECRMYYDLVSKILKKHGFVHYEVSNWAKLGHESKHNYTYWNNEQYYGIGLGASGYIGNKRYTNTKSINAYLNGAYSDYVEIVEPVDEMQYQIMLNLRTIKGLNLLDFKDKFNVDLLKSKKDEIDALIKGGYLLIKDNILIPTYEGMMTLDQIILKLI